MPNQAVLINGAAYDWESITVNIGGKVLAGITAIDYDDDKPIEDNMGAGGMPVSRGRKGYKATASITVEMAEVEALQDAAPNGNLRDYGVFPVIVCYQVGTAIKKHILNNCQFTKNMRSAKTGDSSIEVQLPLNPSDINWKG